MYPVVYSSIAPRFSLLIHDSPRGLHYDFFLEKGEVLKSWALSLPPEPGLEIPCVALADHRLLYLDYEGPISEGRGTVTRWDRGTYAPEFWSDDQIVVELSGAKLVGLAELRRQVDPLQRWLFNWKPGVSKTGK